MFSVSRLLDWCTRRRQPFVFVLLSGAMAFVVSNLIRCSFHGLDISDEGMYLLSAERPTVDSAFHNPFGDYTGLLYRLSFQQVWLFRVLGILILSLAGIFLARAVHRAARPDEIDKWNAMTIGALVAPFYYAIGLYTPSYNWLNLVAICRRVRERSFDPSSTYMACML